MKKKLAKLLICVSMVGLIFSLGACGSDDDSSSKSNSNSNSSSNSSDKKSDKLYSSIKDYIESDEFQAEFSSQVKSFEGSGMSMDITAEGNKLIYVYKYTDEKLIDDTYTLEDAKAYFDKALESQKSTFTSICSQLPLYIDVEDPVLVLRYYDFDDTLIYEKEFTAED